jgi:hypothetical protein
VHVVGAEIREELGAGVELVRVPAGLLKDPDLREPLTEPIVPVREKVRGTCDDQAMSTSMVPPGATGSASGTSSTVLSSVFPSSGAMNRACGNRSAAAAPLLIRSALTSIHPQS